MTPAEQKALGRAAVILLVSGVVRWGFEHSRGPPVEVPGREDQLPRLLEEARVMRDDEERRSRPLEPDETLDVNGAPEPELDRLPGVGPATARAIVEVRDGRGGFRRVDDLLEVRGIGPATLDKIRPHLEVGPMPVVAGRGVSIPVTQAPPPELEPPTIDINTATEVELLDLRGIGPALAERIVAERQRRGGFRTVEELVEVRGIGPATLERIRARVRVR